MSVGSCVNPRLRTPRAATGGAQSFTTPDSRWVLHSRLRSAGRLRAGIRGDRGLHLPERERNADGRCRRSGRGTSPFNNGNGGGGFSGGAGGGGGAYLDPSFYDTMSLSSAASPDGSAHGYVVITEISNSPKPPALMLLALASLDFLWPRKYAGGGKRSPHPSSARFGAAMRRVSAPHELKLVYSPRADFRHVYNSPIGAPEISAPSAKIEAQALSAAPSTSDHFESVFWLLV
jgi:hypothetical protein